MVIFLFVQIYNILLGFIINFSVLKDIKLPEQCYTQRKFDWLIIWSVTKAAKKRKTYVKLQRSEISPSFLPDFRVPQVKNSSYLTIDVLLQTNGTVRGGAAAQRIRGSAAALALSLAFGLELSCLHLFQSLDGHSVHRALWRGGGCGTVSEGDSSTFETNIWLLHNLSKQSWHKSWDEWFQKKFQ